MYIQTNIHTPTYAQLHAYVHTYVHTYIRTNVHTYIHTHIAYIQYGQTDRPTDRCAHAYITSYSVPLLCIPLHSVRQIRAQVWGFPEQKRQDQQYRPCTHLGIYCMCMYVRHIHTWQINISEPVHEKTQRFAE